MRARLLRVLLVLLVLLVVALAVLALLGALLVFLGLTTPGPGWWPLLGLLAFAFGTGLALGGRLGRAYRSPAEIAAACVPEWRNPR